MKKILTLLTLFTCFIGATYAGSNNAQCISQTVPTSVTTGEQFTVKFVFKNTGTNTWRPNGSQSWWLGSANPRDNTIWGSNRGGMVNGTIEPNGTYTFRFTLTAPNQPGVYNCQWQMLQNFVEWFGTPSSNVKINVVRPNHDAAQFISQTAPTSALPGAPVNITLRYKNTGSTTWLKGVYGLASENAPGNTTWGTNRIELPHNVSPGQTVDIPATLTAPSVEGIYRSQWRPSKGGAHRFGAISNTKNIHVGHYYGGSVMALGVPGSVSMSQTFNIDFNVFNNSTTNWNGNVRLNISGASVIGESSLYLARGASKIVRVTIWAPGYATTMHIQAQLSGPYGYFGNMEFLSIPVVASRTKSATISEKTQDLSQKAEFSIYPNPATDFINIQLQNEQVNTVVKLVDLTGKVVKKEVYSNTSTIKFDVAQMNRGIYILQVESSLNNIQRKISLR